MTLQAQEAPIAKTWFFSTIYFVKRLAEFPSIILVVIAIIINTIFILIFHAKG
jgi:hypothetical protein